MYFLIVDVGNDEKVLSAIRERESHLLAKGYAKVIGLRDMYSEAYEKRSGGRIRDEVTAEFIRGSRETIEAMTEPDRVCVHFAIMEIEAWLLLMHNIFQRMHESLSCEHIRRKAGYDLASLDPETSFYRPSQKLKEVLALVGVPYRKSKKDLERTAAIFA